MRFAALCVSDFASFRKVFTDYFARLYCVVLATTVFFHFRVSLCGLCVDVGFYSVNFGMLPPMLMIGLWHSELLLAVDIDDDVQIL